MSYPEDFGGPKTFATREDCENYVNEHNRREDFHGQIIFADREEFETYVNDFNRWAARQPIRQRKDIAYEAWIEYIESPYYKDTKETREIKTGYGAGHPRYEVIEHDKNIYTIPIPGCFQMNYKQPAIEPLPAGKKYSVAYLHYMGRDAINEYLQTLDEESRIYYLNAFEQASQLRREYYAKTKPNAGARYVHEDLFKNHDLGSKNIRELEPIPALASDTMADLDAGIKDSGIGTRSYVDLTVEVTANIPANFRSEYTPECQSFTATGEAPVTKISRQSAEADLRGKLGPQLLRHSRQVVAGSSGLAEVDKSENAPVGHISASDATTFPSEKITSQLGRHSGRNYTEVGISKNTDSDTTDGEAPWKELIDWEQCAEGGPERNRTDDYVPRKRQRLG
jgi:hypothetical protein